MNEVNLEISDAPRPLEIGVVRQYGYHSGDERQYTLSRLVVNRTARYELLVKVRDWGLIPILVNPSSWAQNGVAVVKSRWYNSSDSVPALSCIGAKG